jgi:hypothetical protein
MLLYWRHDTQHNDIENNDTYHNGTAQMALNITVKSAIKLITAKYYRALPFTTHWY